MKDLKALGAHVVRPGRVAHLSSSTLSNLPRLHQDLCLVWNPSGFVLAPSTNSSLPFVQRIARPPISFLDAAGGPAGSRERMRRRWVLHVWDCVRHATSSSHWWHFSAWHVTFRLWQATVVLEIDYQPPRKCRQEHSFLIGDCRLQLRVDEEGHEEQIGTTREDGVLHRVMSVLRH
jgi:hypothetical protein